MSPMTSTKHPHNFSQALTHMRKRELFIRREVTMTLTTALNMANIPMRSGLKLSIPSSLRSLSFVQRGLPFLPKGYTRGDAKLAVKATNIFTGKPKNASGGLIQLFSTAATAGVKDPPKRSINKGDPAHHNSEPVKAPKEPRKDTVSDHHEKTEEKNK